VPGVEKVREQVFRSMFGRVVWSMAGNVCNRFRLRPGARISLVHQPLSADEEAGYILHMFEEYRLSLCRIGVDITGRHVLELGPGDNLGVGLLFLAHGAASFTCIDKFQPVRKPGEIAALYAAIAARLPPESGEVFRALTEGATGEDTFTPPAIRTLWDCPLEEAASRLKGASFDLVISRSVLEYLKDGEAAFAVMDSLLAPGGAMVHKVDCRDDGLFTHYGHSPYTFLMISETVYRWMTSHTYRPNRRRVSWYRSQFARFGYAVHLRITRVMGHSRELPDPAPRLVGGVHYNQDDALKVLRSRAHLAQEFAQLPDEDLLTAGFFISAIKPAWPGDAQPVNA